MGFFDWFKKKEESKSEILLESRSKIESRPLESSLLSEKTEEIRQEIKTEPTKISSPHQEDKLSAIENKLENLRIYLEMINSKLDKLEVLLKSRGLI